MMLSSQEITFSYWYIRHRESLWRFFWAMVVSIVILCWLFVFLWGFQYANARQDMAGRFSQQSAMYTDFVSDKPAGVSMIYDQIVRQDDGTYDRIVKFANNNNQWVLRSAEYHLDGVDGVVSAAPFSMQTETDTYVLLFDLSEQEKDVAGVVRNISWTRYYDWLYFIDIEKLFMADPAFSYIVDPETNAQVGSRVQATIINESDRMFYNVPVTVVLSTGNKVVASARITLDEVDRRSETPIQFTWTEFIPQPGQNGIDLRIEPPLFVD
jgi:hypothetical protein